MYRCQFAKAIAVCGSTALLAASLSSPVQATWFYSANSVFQTDAPSVSHPDSLSQVLLMPNDAVRPLVCVSYGNSLGRGKQGRVVTTVRITTPETEDLFGLPVSPVVRTVTLSGQVKSNSLLECRATDDILAGDVVEFDHAFKGMPSLRAEGGETRFAEVSGVVSDAGKPTLWNAPNGFRLPEGNSPSGVIPGGEDGWHHAINSVYQAEQNGQKHPRKIQQTLLIPSAAAKPMVCAGYSNMAGNGSKGRLVTTATLSRADGSVEKLKLISRVRNNTVISCKDAGALGAGDFVDFSFTFKGMPKLGRYQQTIEFADVTGVVTTAGEPVFRTESPPPPAPLPDPNPPQPDPPPSAPPSTGSPGSPSPQPPPTSGGSLSSADLSAAAKLLNGNTKTQLQRPNGDSPSKWLVVGPKTQAYPNSNKLVLNTAGVGNTIAAAVADYERKMGSLGAGAAITSGEASALSWYSNMSSANGPTAVRRDSGGGYHGEYYRTSHGANHAGPMSSLQAALNWLQSRGL